MSLYKTKIYMQGKFYLYYHLQEKKMIKLVAY